MKPLTIIYILLLYAYSSYGQLYPNDKSGVEFLATYGNMSLNDAVENDYSQTIFFAVKEKTDSLFYLRVFDPDCGGKYDKKAGLWETNTLFEVIGGEGCISLDDSRKSQPSGQYKAGVVLERQIFAKESKVDGEWVSFGPFSAFDGEALKNYPGYRFFKVIVEGRTGNDINLYSMFISKSPEMNVDYKDAFPFQYEYTYLDEGSFSVVTKNNIVKEGLALALPIELPELQEEYQFSIEALPIEEK